MTTTAVPPELVDATRSALRRFGYQGATLERIAGEAGISRVTLHRRGVTKNLLIGALTELATDEYRSAMWPALTSSGTARERMERALAALCDVAERNLDLLVALRAQSDAVFHEDGREEALTRSVFTEPLERLLRDGIADGSLRAVDPVEAATVLFNQVGWTYVHLRTGHRWKPARARKATLDLALHGIVALG
jgi:AcrR family transcriptional regulator